MRGARGAAGDGKGMNMVVFLGFLIGFNSGSMVVSRYFYRVFKGGSLGFMLFLTNFIKVFIVLL